MQESLGKKLGIAAVCVLIFILLAVPMVLFGNLYHFHAVGFFLIFSITTLLNTAILYWPAHVTGAMQQTALRVMIKIIVSGLVILTLVLAVAVLLPNSLITLFLSDNNALLFFFGLNLLALAFLLSHYFLFRFFRAWLSSPMAHAVGIGGFLVAVYLFFFHWIGRWLDWSDLMALFGFMIGQGSRNPQLVELYGFYYLIMQYFFITLMPYYLTALMTTKKFPVSHWMHVVYLYVGISGLVGFFSVVIYAL